MVIIDEYKIRFQNAKESAQEVIASVDVDAIKEELSKIDAIVAEPDFWNDTNRSKEVFAKQSSLKNRLAKRESLERKADDCEAMISIIEETEDDSLIEELVSLLEDFETTVRTVTMDLLLSGEYDKNNAILTIHAGAGGTEAQDWGQMLYRMYVRWAERHKFSTKILDWLDGDEAGIKSVSVLISGENAYGYLKSENGVHRLVRISPFDASGRRQTSFASIEVMPEIGKDVNVNIRDEDIQMDVYRASGKGGQKVNKTSSAVRLTHIPTGIVVSCQVERSQYQNRDVCMQMLKAKLIEIKEREHLEKIEDIKGVQMDIGWGSQIRSYVFMPYTMVKDHRTNYETGNVAAVMDGDLDGFINAYLLMKSKENMETVN
ncbi:MAG: peptide chain release factor 2 [Oscillospiraceae bacterium]|nr:peptide chain release factor 2 [Oscillospiraceae bacterium]